MKNTNIKTLLFGLFLSTAASSAFAQGTIGTVTFHTFNGGNLSQGKVFLPDGITPPGPSYVGQLWWSDTSNGPFVAAGTPQQFATNSPNYVLGGNVAIPGRSGGAMVFLQMRVWNSAAGSNWCIAMESPLLSAYGITQTKSRILGGLDWDDNLYSPQQFNTFVNMTMYSFGPSGCTPAPTPSTLAFSNSGTGLVLSWSGPFVLQSATNATGVYSDILVFGVPHTESTTAVGQRFFRLRD